MRETARSLRLYCALVGAASVVLPLFGIRGVFMGLMGLVAMFRRSPDYFWVLQALSPVFQFGAGVVLLYIAWSLPHLLTSNLTTARALFVAVATLTMLHSFADWLFGFGLVSFGVTLGAVVIVSYLYANFRRLSSAAATDLTSASSGIG